MTWTPLSGPIEAARRVAAGLRHGTVRQMARFAAVGVVSTVIDFSIFAALHYGLAVGVVPANVASYSVAVVNSYVLNRSWTFAGQATGRAGPRQFLLFLGFNLGGVALSTLVVWLLAAAMPAMLAKTAALAVTFTWNFWTNRLIVYRAR